MTSSKEDRRGRERFHTGKRIAPRRVVVPAAGWFIPDWLKISAVVVVAVVGAVLVIGDITSSNLATTTTLINDNVNARLEKTDGAVSALKESVDEVKRDVVEIKIDVVEIKKDIGKMTEDIDGLAQIHPTHHAASRPPLHVSHGDGAD